MPTKPIKGVHASIIFDNTMVSGLVDTVSKHHFGTTMTVRIEPEQVHFTDLYILIQGEYIKVGRIETDLLAQIFFEDDNE